MRNGQPDYESDFLSTITGVGWASGGFQIQLNQSVNGSIDTLFRVDFPDSSGGTPGLILFNGVQIGFGPSGAAAYSHGVPNGGAPQDSWTRERLTAGGGLALLGFATHADFPFGTIQSVLNLKTAGMPADPYRLRITNQVSGSVFGTSLTISIATSRKGIIKSGLQSPVIDTLNFDFGAPLTSGGTEDFQIDPVTLLITGPL